MELSVEGYKSIVSKQSLEFDGLTILAGANSSGKSSFMQPFLILKQTIERNYDSGVLALYGENVKLTDSSQLVSKLQSARNKSFSLEMSTSNLLCKVSYKYKREHGFQIESVEMKNKEIPDGLLLKIGMKSEEIQKRIPEKEFKILIDLADSNKLKPKWKALKEKCFIKAELSFGEKEFIPIKAGIEPTRQLEAFVTKLIHVPGLRGNPERRYKTEPSLPDTYLGSFEKYVANIISGWGRKNSKNNVKYNLLNNHLAELGLGKTIKASKVDDTSVEITISRFNQSSDNDCVSIADVGFGVSQTIPVLTALIAAQKGQYVYIEQPELHLHPKAQFKLASIISSAVNRGINVIIETHSSILLRGIQTIVAKKELDYEKVSLNWFSQNAKTGETEVSKAKLDEFGAFGDWPEDFDDTILSVEQQYLDAVEEASL